MQTTNKLMHTIVSTEAKNKLMVPACFNKVNFGTIETTGTNFNSLFQVNDKIKIPPPLTTYVRFDPGLPPVTGSYEYNSGDKY